MIGCVIAPKYYTQVCRRLCIRHVAPFHSHFNSKKQKKIHNKIKANTMKSRLSVCALTSMLHALTAIMLTVLHTYVDCISYHIMHWLIILERITKIAGMCIVCIFIFYFLFLSHLSSAPQQLHLITALFT